jgi:orotate phosphoribosyltransferase-like protein
MKNNRNRNIDKAKLIELYEKGIKALVIAKELNIGRSTVFKIVKEEDKTRLKYNLKKE